MCGGGSDGWGWWGSMIVGRHLFLFQKQTSSLDSFSMFRNLLHLSTLELRKKTGSINC